MKTKIVLALALLGCKAVSFAQQYEPACIPSPGLMAYWPINSASNADAAGYPSITVSGAVLTSDRFGNASSAYRFDGLNDYIETSYAGILGSAPRAVSFWAMVPVTRVNVLSGVGMYPVAWGANSTGQRFGCSLDFPADQVAIGGANCYQSFSNAGFQIDDGVWHHYVFQYSGNTPGDFTTVEVYIDGVCAALSLSVASGATNPLNTVNTGAHNVHFGKTNFSTPSFFEGDLDEVAIWSRTLTPCEIHTLFDCTGCDACCESGRSAKSAEPIAQTLKNISATATGKTPDSNAKDIVVLTQNVPNPFAESTVISYNLPAGSTKAEMIFTNTEGTVVKTVNLDGRTSGNLTVYANDLSRGIYSYALVVDGKTLERKKMIRE